MDGEIGYLLLNGFRFINLVLLLHLTHGNCIFISVNGHGISK